MKQRPIKNILVANRGEIAIRIMRTCRDMGIRSVAVFSDADRDAPHVRMADEALHIGPSPASQSYLLQDAIIKAARQTGADAIHPGYGFLSENSSFARNSEKAGITFIGPPYKAMKLLGDKTEARKLARKHGIPITKGATSSITSVSRLKMLAAEIGFPVLLKAAGGGGGKGMKIVWKEGELDSAYRIAQSEAQSAFGDERIYVEQYITNPRHIEVQILADKYGNVVHLGERECSIQRRHQKIIEETPSPAVSATLRKNMTSAAITLIKKAGYYNAATVEYLLDEKGKFYFLEVNTRLQVEHPVTEMVTGIDLVREQILIAEGHRLGFLQKNIDFKGSAIECRIYAEDPANNFFPSTGTVRYLHTPGGPFVRVESGIEQGQEISPFYDPLLMKLVSWGRTRKSAHARMSRCLSELQIFGVGHNAELCHWVLNHDSFSSGDFSTNFLQQNFRGADSFHRDPAEIDAVAAVGAVFHHQGGSSPEPVVTELPSTKWKAERQRQLR